MVRFALTAALLIFAGAVGAAGQTNLPFYPVPPPNMLQIPPPVAPPPAVAPHMAPIPPVMGPGGPIIIPQGRIIHRPGESFGERMKRCIHLGTAAGVPSSEIGRFAAECAR